MKSEYVDSHVKHFPIGVTGYALLRATDGTPPEAKQKTVFYTRDIDPADLDETINGLQEALGLSGTAIIPFAIEDERAETFVQHQREVKKPNTAARK